MNSPSPSTAVLDPLDRLTQRIRWKRWLGKLHRFAWMLAAVFFLLFLADCLCGMDTLSLRIASVAVLVLAGGKFLADWIVAWRVRLDRIGLAHLLEKRNPGLAERLVTLVQLDANDSHTGFAQLLEAETARRLADVEPKRACPLVKEWDTWMVTVALLTVIFGGLACTPAFASFTDRFLHAWVTPLVPFTIDVNHGNGYALRGQSCTIEATVHMLDERTEAPIECALVCEEETGSVKRIAMTASAEKFVAILENVQKPLRCRVEAAGYASETFAIQLIEAPVFLAKPTILIKPPSYRKEKSAVRVLDDTSVAKVEILRFSKMRFQFPLDRLPAKAWLHLTMLPASEKDAARHFRIPVQWNDGTIEGSADAIAKQSGMFEAKLALELEHGLSTSLPLGRWTVYDDRVPRFTQPLRLHGGAAILQSHQEYRVAPDDLLRLQMAVEDAEGLGAIAIEYRINDGPSRLEHWLHGKDRQELAIDDWLPLPSTLKEKDRVQFRIRIGDNRRLRRGEILQTSDEILPAQDLTPQIAIAPAGAGDDGWITLRVDRTIEGFLQQQAKAQASDVIDIVGKIKKKLHGESEQIQQLQRTIHQQTALMPAQAKQAEKIQALNREIMEDLNRAGEHFLTNPALARLAEHFFDIAETDIQKSGEALERFREKDRPLPEAEKELKVSQEALAQASKKLERMLDWNKMIAQDRLDQWQIEKLEKRQKELAQRLEKLLEQQPLSDAELAKEIEAIRQEQAKLAEQTAQLQTQSKLVQDSLAALEQMRVQRLAEAAEKLSAEQKAMRELDPEKMPAEIKARLDKLASDLLELAQKGSGPEAKAMAKESAQTLDEAKKAMEASQAMKAKGDASEAKKMEDEAAKKLELAVKQLAKFAQDQAMKNMPKEDAEKTAEALQQSNAKMRQAEANLPKMPKDAQAAMEAAAKKLAEAVNQANKQAARNLPNPPARNPAAKAPNPSGGGLPTAILKNVPLDASVGKAWGELPGELKTRMLQDFRARYGEDYAEMIRQYFERLAETPARKE